MAQASFAYASPDKDPAGLALAVSVYADRAHLREQMREDAEAAGLAALARPGDDPQRIDLPGPDQPGRCHLGEIAEDGIARAANRDDFYLTVC